METKSKLPNPSLIPDDNRLKLVKRISKLMDEEFSIGNFKFGLDPILSFVPVVGDAGSYIISITLIITMLQHGASGKVVAKMVANATLDALIGAIPVLGWIFDFTYKANVRNVKLLTQHYTEDKHRGSAVPIIIGVLTVMVVVLAIIIFMLIKLFMWLDSLIVLG